MYILLGRWGSDGRALAQELLRLGVERRYGLSALPQMGREERGKPFFPRRRDIHFNLSHSGGACLCAVGDAPVGVDIELLRPLRPGLARRALSDREYSWYQGRGEEQGDFFTLWTRKEALGKYTGRGVADVKGVTPPLPGEESASPAIRSWAGEGWRAAVCGEGELPREIVWLSAPAGGARSGWDTAFLP